MDDWNTDLIQTFVEKTMHRQTHTALSSQTYMSRPQFLSEYGHIKFKGARQTGHSTAARVLLNKYFGCLIVPKLAEAKRHQQIWHHPFDPDYYDDNILDLRHIYSTQQFKDGNATVHFHKNPYRIAIIDNSSYQVAIPEVINRLLTHPTLEVILELE